MKISVIIPCYNVEKTIADTLDSLVVQTFQEFEVIIVDDGSEDNTRCIVENYISNHDLNAKLICQNNNGVSSARNNGIRNCEGEFITFLDGDDAYLPDFLMILYCAIKESKKDIAFCKYELVNHIDIEIKQIEGYKCKEVSRYEMLDIYMHKRKEKVNFFCAIYRRILIEKQGIIFPEDISYGEDSEFFCKYLYHSMAGGIYLDLVLYRYFIREGSATRTVNYSKVQTIKAFQRIVEYWKNDSAFTQEISDYLISRAIWSIAKNFAMDNYKYFVRLKKEYDVRNAMKLMSRYGDELSIRISSKIYLLNSELFALLMRLYLIF